MNNDTMEKYECPMITIEKRGNLYYVSDNKTDIVGKGKNRDAAIKCYHRGLELLQRRSVGME